MPIYDRDRIEDVSKSIAELRYEEMRELGRRLFDFAIDREEFAGAQGLDAQAFAELLADWSQSVEREIAEFEADGEE